VGPLHRTKMMLRIAVTSREVVWLLADSSGLSLHQSFIVGTGVLLLKTDCGNRALLVAKAEDFALADTVKLREL
jgi:hypothetical protein